MSSYNLETLCMDICVYNFCVQGGVGGPGWYSCLQNQEMIMSDFHRDSCQTFQIVPTFLVLKSLKNYFGAIVDGRLTKVSGPFQRLLGFMHNFHSRILLNLPHISTMCKEVKWYPLHEFASGSNGKTCGICGKKIDFSYNFLPRHT